VAEATAEVVAVATRWSVNLAGDAWVTHSDR
jgi:hypothetical protein